MTINLNNSATTTIPHSNKICPLIAWILISMGFILFALFEYFFILVLLRFGNKVWDVVSKVMNIRSLTWSGEGKHQKGGR